MKGSLIAGRYLTFFVVPVNSPLSALLIETPLDPASTGDEEKNKAIESGQLALIDRWKKPGSHLEFPVELKISHGHRAACEESRRACLQPQHHGQPSEELDHAAEPQLGPGRRPELGKEP